MSAPATPKTSDAKTAAAAGKKRLFDEMVGLGADKLGRLVNTTLRTKTMLSKQACVRMACMQKLVATSVMCKFAAAEYLDDDDDTKEKVEAEMLAVMEEAKKANLSKRDLGRLGPAICQAMGPLSEERSEYFCTLVESKAELQREVVFADATIDAKVAEMEGSWDRAQTRRIMLAERNAKAELAEMWEKTPAEAPAAEDARNAAMRAASGVAKAKEKRKLAVRVLSTGSSETFTERLRAVMKRAKVSDEWCSLHEDESE